MGILVKGPVKRTVVFLMVICFLFISQFSRAQIFEDRGYWSELMRYNILPVDSLWLFHSGDDKLTSVTKDSGWELANTKLLTDDKGQPLPGFGVGWYQKTFDVPPAFRSKPAEFRMGHFGASEIFLDGKLIRRYGEVANTVENEEIFLPHDPVFVFLDSQSSHSLLVHYSNMHAGLPYYNSKHIGFRLFIAPANVFPQTEPSKIPTLPISASIMFLFSVFFLFVYFFYPKRLASLLTTILLLNFAFIFVGIYLSVTESEWEPLRKAAIISEIGNLWTNLLPILVLYALYYNGKMPRRSILIIIAMIICVFAVLYPQFGMLIPFIIIPAYFELFRMIILGIMKKKPGFWILLVGSIIQQAGFFVIVLDIFHWFPVYTPTVLLMQLLFPQLGVPLTYALQFAWEFGRANRDLRGQLTQVKTLSESTLRHEQEKQEMLTQQKEKLEIMVSDRTSELSDQKEALQNTLENLESAQAQLIQAEKMASLGELTAGIAHEIQNPLNFINNFSEVNKELIEELKAECLKPKADRNDQLEEELLNNLINNEEKINHHGQRADAIVKGMLQHSRTSAGKKETIDINALADEYLRLAYHGFRAKDNSFNAVLQTDFDPSVGKINIVPQDIGRVLLNLYNNAFYAANEKKKRHDGKYEPTISIKTMRAGDKLSISVKDNGSGIPQKVKDKIFQPFFTTKPTGQGTGLGLSMSYDIIKAHGGEIKVETKEAEYTEFVVHMPRV